METNQIKEARKLLNSLIEQNSSLEGYQLLSKVESHAGNSGYSHFYLAIYYQKLKEYPLAMTQLRYARENAGSDFYLSSRVNDLMDTISPHIEKISLQSKRKRKTQINPSMFIQ
jgi:predicted Zn-dependent protease